MFAEVSVCNETWISTRFLYSQLVVEFSPFATAFPGGDSCSKKEGGTPRTF